MIDDDVSIDELREAVEHMHGVPAGGHAPMSTSSTLTQLVRASGGEVM